MTYEPVKRDKIFPAGRTGIVDIGSNSVRLVIYEGTHRSPAPDFNEKALCAIGRGIASTQRLDPQGVDAAIKALERFRIVAEARGVRRLEAVATAAVRDARNGAEFLARARSALGADVRLLPGELEAKLAAEGVLGGIPEADGLVGDLGGGSLELTPVLGQSIAPGFSLPLGPLRLMDVSGGRIDRARLTVDLALESLRGLDKMKGKALYAVGGVWRSIAKIHMRRAKHPVKVLHAYTMERDDAIEHTEYLASRSRRALEDIGEETRKRADTVPFGAVVMERLLKASRLDRVVVSSYGVREGLLFQRLPEDVRRLDPLLATARDMAARESRDPALEEVLFQWTQPLFPTENAADARLRRAACILSDLVWRGHPDHRADDISHQVLHGNFTGIDHPGRAFLAFALHHRYAGAEEPPDYHGPLREFAGDQVWHRAATLGAALRFAYMIAGATAGIISQTSVRLTPSQLIFSAPAALQPLWCDAVERRLDDLASMLKRAKRLDFR